jgi:uncharacterized surface protein with fasciclin (FAS1) repeats
MLIKNQKKKISLTSILLGLLVVVFCVSCTDKFENIEKYQRPERLQGKIFTLIASQKNMTIFSQFMIDTGYDKVLDKTGTYAVFVPSDSVMKIYLTEKYGTFDPANIDSTVKQTIVKYHILPMPWSKDQLQNLSSRGWINLSDISNNKPTAFKRKTLLREPNRTYKVQRYLSGNEPYDIIVPENTAGTVDRTVFTSSPKYVPLFFDGFMSAKGLTAADYSFYFERPYTSGEVYYANSQIIGNEIFAENGFVYLIDKVVEPLKNAEQLLESGNYAAFLQLIHNKSVFQFNSTATLAQKGADEGMQVEDLYNLNYTSTFPINIHDELVVSSTYSVERHNGLLAPTDAAMTAFFNEYLKSWGSSWNSVPKNIQRLFVNTHIANEAIYLKDINNGFYNTAGDFITKNDFEVERAQYGSNATFLGLKKAIVPKYFSSVSAPLFLDPAFKAFFGAYSSVNLLSSLKNINSKFSLFLIDNTSLANDSSLFVSEQPDGTTQITAYNHSESVMVNMLSSDYKGILTRRLYGHIAIQPVLGVAKKEFVETLDGRHLVIQHDTITGGLPSEFGFNSSKVTTNVFSKITNFPITNGQVYKCNSWLRFSSNSTYGFLRNTKFLDLLIKAGLADKINEQLTFMSSTEQYTILVPSDAALNSIQADKLSLTDLKTLLSFHIVKGKFIFTDGRQPAGAYRTLNDSFINLRPEPDNLVILDKNKAILYSDLKLSAKSNLIGTYTQNISENYYITNAVVHNINTVIMPY